MVTVGVTIREPSLFFVPDQPPDAVQELAEGADQESWEVPLDVMDEGVAVREMAGGAGGVGVGGARPVPAHAPPGEEPYSYAPMS